MLRSVLIVASALALLAVGAMTATAGNVHGKAARTLATSTTLHGNAISTLAKATGELTSDAARLNLIPAATQPQAQAQTSAQAETDADTTDEDGDEATDEDANEANDEAAAPAAPVAAPAVKTEQEGAEHDD